MSGYGVIPRELDDSERLAWVRLIRSENVGPATFSALIFRFGTATRAIEALPHLARRGGRSKPLTLCAEADAAKEVEAVAKLGARLIALPEPDYPAPLRVIDQAPPILCLKGDASFMHRPMVAIVGARNASAAGRRLAETLARDLSAQGFVIVSGLARGIDSAAHRGALGNDRNGGTAAVMAGGIDHIYPPENGELYHAIAAQGCLVSEMPPGLTPQARHFPRRNRIVSGLSLGAIVVEAAMRSGSLITARLALEQGREVFAVPGSPLDPRAKGCNNLLRQGATLVEEAQDVVAVLSPLARNGQAALFSESGADMDLSAREEASMSPQTPPLETTPGGDDDHARRIVTELIGATPMPQDEIIRQSGLPAAQVIMVLLELELAGRLIRQPGQRVALVAPGAAPGAAQGYGL